MELLLIFLTLSLLPALLFVLKHKKSEPSNTPPGPPRLPFIGNLHQIDVSCLHKYLWKLSQKYGPIMFLKFGSTPTLVVSSARLAEEVMKNQDLIFCSRPRMLGQQKLSYYGSDIAFSPYNQEWREMKKIGVLHLLGAKKMQQFRPIREDEVSRMMRKIRKDAELGNKVTDLTETLMFTAKTMIFRTAFGKRLDDESPEWKRFDAVKAQQLQAMLMGFFWADYFPSLGYWIDYVTGMHFRLQTTFRKADYFYQQVIDEHLDPNRPSSMDGDIVDIMLRLQRDQSTSVTLDHVKAMLMNVFLGGTETSVITVIWAMTALMKNPSVMKKLQAEMREVMGEKEFLDEDDVKKLPYLTATVKETLRVFPTVPLLLPRSTMKRCRLDGYEIEANTMVYVNIWAIGRDPNVWENANEFFPDKFLNSDIDFKGRDFDLIPFGAGRRSCPGYQTGLVTVHLILANLLHSFDWGFPTGMSKEDLDTESLLGLSMHKKNALKLLARIPTTDY